MAKKKSCEARKISGKIRNLHMAIQMQQYPQGRWYPEIWMWKQNKSVNKFGKVILSHGAGITTVIFNINLVAFQINTLLIFEFVKQDSVLKS